MRTARVSPVAGSTGDAVYLLPAPKVAVQTDAPSCGRQGWSHHVGVTQFQQWSSQWQCHRHRAAARYERHYCLQQLQEPAWHVAPQGERRRPDWSLQHQLWQLRVQRLPGERRVTGRRWYCVPLNGIRRDVGEGGGTVVAYLTLCSFCLQRQCVVLSISPVFHNTSPVSALYRSLRLHTQSTKFSFPPARPPAAVISSHHLRRGTKVTQTLCLCQRYCKLTLRLLCLHWIFNNDEFKLHNLATPDQAAVLFTAICYLFLLSLWKLFFFHFH